MLMKGSNMWSGLSLLAAVILLCTYDKHGKSPDHAVHPHFLVKEMVRIQEADPRPLPAQASWTRLMITTFLLSTPTSTTNLTVLLQIRDSPELAVSTTLLWWMWHLFSVSSFGLNNAHFSFGYKGITTSSPRSGFKFSPSWQTIS